MKKIGKMFHALWSRNSTPKCVRFWQSSLIGSGNVTPFALKASLSSFGIGGTQTYLSARGKHKKSQ